jgi:DNA (cytosine-5)-methyltransferase 1
MKIVSLFSGTGGLDRGFENEGFKVVWANEYDKSIWSTFESNFPHTVLDKRNIVDINPNDAPACDGIIGGPPCQSWSEAGAARGINDPRGQLFNDYIKFIKAKKPKFFLAENVQGLLFSKHSDALDNIFKAFLKIGYNVSYHLLNSNDYGVPQDRKRVIIVGYPVSYGEHFIPPEPEEYKPTLKDAIWDLRKNAKPALRKNKANPKLKIPNHEYMIGSFSTMYMSRNRVRSWDEPSFTIQAGGRHAPCHPQAPKMVKVKKDKMKFKHGSTKLYRRLSVRECARIQTFPDSHIFNYESVPDGYKMIGNAVAVDFAAKIAAKIRDDLKRLGNMPVDFNKKGTLKLPN